MRPMKRLVCLLLTIACSVFASDHEPQSTYKLYCMYTPDFHTLLRQYFLPSIKDDFDLDISEFPQECPAGTFRSNGWDETMLRKLELLERAVMEHWNDRIFFYSDIDITFLKPILDISLNLLGSNDFVVQQGWPRNGLCAGFFVMRGNERTLGVILAAQQLLREKICIDDQEAIQKALDDRRNGEISWGFLPAEQFPNGRRVLKHTHGHYSEASDIELDDSILLFHANCCIGLENKYHFIRRVEELHLTKQSYKQAGMAP